MRVLQSGLVGEGPPGHRDHRGRGKNRRAEAYWEARELCEAGLIDIEPEDLDLQAELLEVHFKVDSTGRTQIEDKEDISARLGRSPDRADAFVYSLQKAAVLSETSMEQPVEQEELFQPISEREKIQKELRDPDFEPTDNVTDILDLEF